GSRQEEIQIRTPDLTAGDGSANCALANEARTTDNPVRTRVGAMNRKGTANALAHHRRSNDGTSTSAGECAVSLRPASAALRGARRCGLQLSSQAAQCCRGARPAARIPVRPDRASRDWRLWIWPAGPLVPAAVVWLWPAAAHLCVRVCQPAAC